MSFGAAVWTTTKLVHASSVFEALSNKRGRSTVEVWALADCSHHALARREHGRQHCHHDRCGARVVADLSGVVARHECESVLSPPLILKLLASFCHCLVLPLSLTVPLY